MLAWPWGCPILPRGTHQPTQLSPLSPAWQSISRLPAGTGALSWDKNSHVCLPMDRGWQKVKTSPVQLCWACHVPASRMDPQYAGDGAGDPGHHSRSPATEAASLGHCWSPGAAKKMWPRM